MILHGINVTLRPIELEDAELLRTMINDPKMEAFVVGYSFRFQNFNRVNG